VDWKRLVQFALLGSSDLEQYAILLVRVSLGLFFAISGETNCLSPAARNLFTKRSLRPKSQSIPTGSASGLHGQLQFRQRAVNERDGNGSFPDC
jgi:hypothetical protein